MTPAKPSTQFSSRLSSLFVGFVAAIALGTAFLAHTSFASEPITVKVSGMTCGNCVKSITEALKGIEGVEPGSIEVSLKGQTAKLKVLKADQKTLEAVRSAIEKLKYTVEPIIVGEEASSKGS